MTTTTTTMTTTTTTTATAPTKFENLRAAVRRAEQIEAELAAGTSADAEVIALREEIASCENDAEALTLLKKLGTLELLAKLRSIRSSRLSADKQAAWEAAGAVAAHAVDEVAAMVLQATGDAFQRFYDMASAAIQPEILSIMQNDQRFHSQIFFGLETFCGALISVGRANLLQRQLADAQSKGHYTGLETYCRKALGAIDNAIASLPEVAAESARLAAACDAFTAALQ